jgi:hypothetical protein
MYSAVMTLQVAIKMPELAERFPQHANNGIGLVAETVALSQSSSFVGYFACEALR